MRSAIRSMVSTILLISPARLPISRLTLEDREMDSRICARLRMDFCTAAPLSSASRANRLVVSVADFVKDATERAERSICEALEAAIVASSVIFKALAETPSTERASSSVEEKTCSTVEARLSVIALTCSMDTAVSLIQADVSSAATVRSAAFEATLSIERVICSMVAEISPTDIA